MKPQCNSAADCLRELARVMEQFGIANMLSAVNSRYVRFEPVTDDSFDIGNDFFRAAQCWSFAIAEVEGKPVFIGDELYDWKGDAHTVPYLNDGTKMDLRKGCEWTWNPPKPKTVMVEMLIEDAKSLTSAESLRIFDIMALNTRVREACKKALEELK